MGLNSRKRLDWVRTALREHAESLVLAVLLALLVRWFVLAAYVVRSDSMSPSFLSGDIVLGFKPPFGVLGTSGREPRRGELVIFDCPGGGGLCLRRIVGLEGDRLEMKKQRLYVNGAPCDYGLANGEKLVLAETCLGTSRRVSIAPDWEAETWGPVMTPPRHLFLMNDFRPDREDSRRWGGIPYDHLRSTAVAVWISFDWSASNGWPEVRWHRTFLRVN